MGRNSRRKRDQRRKQARRWTPSGTPPSGGSRERAPGGRFILTVGIPGMGFDEEHLDDSCPICRVLREEGIEDGEILTLEQSARISEAMTQVGFMGGSVLVSRPRAVA
jgi:hypothetical protein